MPGLRLKDLTDCSSTISDDDLLMIMDNPAAAGTTTKVSVSSFMSALSIPQSETDGITGAVQINNIVAISQTAYDALGAYDVNTLYFIT